MPIFIDPSGEPTFGIGICARCGCKKLLSELYSDPNSPGLMVCIDDLDEYDPYRLPARPTEEINLPFYRPDLNLNMFATSGVGGVGSSTQNPPPPLLMGAIGNPSAQLDWTAPGVNAAAITDRYTLFRSTNVLPTNPSFGGSFAEVNQQDADIFGPLVTGFSYNDPGLDFVANFFHYFVQARRTAGPNPLVNSNIIALAEPAGPVVLSGVFDSVDNEFDLSWTASTPGPVPIDRYCVFRSVNGAPFALIGEVPDPGLTFTDDDPTIDRSTNTYNYYIVVYDDLGLASDPSNIVNFPAVVSGFLAGTIALFDTDKDTVISPDGITWTGVNSGAVITNNWRGSNFGNSRWMVVGDTGAVRFSDDGLNWTEVASGNALTWVDVIYVPPLDLWVAAGGDATNAVMTSGDNGLTWTLRATPMGVAGTALTFEAVSGRVVVGGTGNNNICHSLDGISWTNSIFPAGSSQASEIAAIGGNVVTGNRGDINNWRSTDGGVNMLLNANQGVGGGITAMSEGNAVIAVSGPAAGFGVFSTITGAGPFTQEQTTPPNNLECIGYDSSLDTYVGWRITAAEVWYSVGDLSSWLQGTVPTGYALSVGVRKVAGGGLAVVGPDAPVASKSVDVPSSSITVTWTAPAGTNPLLQYFVFQSKNAAPFGLIATVPAASPRSITVTGVSTVPVFDQFYVVAMDTLGLISPNSNVVDSS